MCTIYKCKQSCSLDSYVKIGLTSNTLKMRFPMLSFLGVILCVQSISCIDYGVMNILYWKADANLDSIITPAEFASIFRGFDTNGDGQTDRAEFVQWWVDVTENNEDTANGYFILCDSDDNSIINNTDYRTWYAVFDANGDGQVSAQEFGDAWADVGRSVPFAVVYYKADTDRDHHVTAAEIITAFAFFDISGDGISSLAEFTQIWMNNRFGSVHEASDVFNHLDTNHDGMLDPATLRTALGAVDTNGDGTLSLREVIQLQGPPATPATQ